MLSHPPPSSPSLRALLHPEGSPLPLRVVASLAEALLEALKARQARGRFGGLRPERFVMEDSGRFRFQEDLPPSPSPIACYESPEALNGTVPDELSDQFALAVMVAEAATGTPVFPGPTPELAERAAADCLTGPARRTSASRSPALAAALSVALERRPDGRFASCLEWTRQLKARIAPDADPADLRRWMKERSLWLTTAPPRSGPEDSGEMPVYLKTLEHITPLPERTGGSPRFTAPRPGTPLPPRQFGAPEVPPRALSSSAIPPVHPSTPPAPPPAPPPAVPSARPPTPPPPPPEEGGFSEQPTLMGVSPLRDPFPVSPEALAQGVTFLEAPTLGEDEPPWEAPAIGSRPPVASKPSFPRWVPGGVLVLLLLVVLWSTRRGAEEDSPMEISSPPSQALPPPLPEKSASDVPASQTPLPPAPAATAPPPAATAPPPAATAPPPAAAAPPPLTRPREVRPAPPRPPSRNAAPQRTPAPPAEGPTPPADASPLPAASDVIPSKVSELITDAPGVRGCLATAPARGILAPGDAVIVRLQLSPDGVVNTAKVAGKAQTDPALVSCLVSAIQGVRFPPFREPNYSLATTLKVP